MQIGNAAGFFRRADVCRLIVCTAGLLLGGCSHAVRKPASPPVPTPVPVITGIPACDSYLNIYLACHRAAGIYPPDALQTHYQTMRNSMLQDVQDPRVRPYLANRCMGLTQQLSAALSGRSCSVSNSENQAASK